MTPNDADRTRVDHPARASGAAGAMKARLTTIEPGPAPESGASDAERRRMYRTMERAEARMRRQSERLRALVDAARELAGPAASTAEIVQMASERVADALGDGCVIRLLDAAGVLSPAAAARRPVGATELESQTILTGQAPGAATVSGYVALAGEPAFIPMLADPSALAFMTPGRRDELLTIGVHSQLVVPLRVRNAVIGTLGVARHRTPEPYELEDIEFLQEFADRTALALDNARLLAESQQAAAEARAQADRLLFLTEISRLLNEAPLEIHQLGAVLAQQLGSWLGDNCMVRIITDSGEYLTPISIYSPDPELAQLSADFYRQTLTRIDEGLPGRILQTRQAILIPDITPEGVLAEFGEQYRTLVERAGVYSLMALPLEARGRLLGTLSLTRSTPQRPYTAADLALTESVAGRAAILIDNAMLLREAQAAAERARQQAAQLALLAALSRELAEAPFDVHEIGGTIARRIGEHLGDTCVVRLLSDDGQWLDPVGMYHIDAHQQAFMEAQNAAHPNRVDEGLPGLVFKAGETLLLPEITTDAMYDLITPHYAEYLERSSISSALLTPLRARGRVIGTLAVSRVNPGTPFSDSDRALIENIGERLALAFDHARLFAREQYARAVAQEAVSVRDRALLELNIKHAEIQALNTQLEDRVLERTAALAATNAELEAFSYAVTHDLRAPLRSIDGFSQALLEDFGDALDETGRGYLERVRLASRHMGLLIDDLLSLARVTRSEMRQVAVDLSAMAGDVLTELCARQPERRVEVRIEPGLHAHGDPRLLRVAIVNLIENAWKFTAKTDPARISCGRVARQGQLAYYVQDNGAGFDMTYADKLFNPFQRLHAPSEFEGTGIGLATVQRVIRRHGGAIWAEAAVDQGATFYFTLEPWHAEPAESDA